MLSRAHLEVKDARMRVAGGYVLQQQEICDVSQVTVKEGLRASIALGMIKRADS